MTETNKQLSVRGSAFVRNTAGIARYYARVGEYLQQLEGDNMAMKDSVEKIQAHLKSVETENASLKQQIAAYQADEASLANFAGSFETTPDATLTTPPAGGTVVSAAPVATPAPVKDTRPLIQRLG